MIVLFYFSATPTSAYKLICQVSTLMSFCCLSSQSLICGADSKSTHLGCSWQKQLFHHKQTKLGSCSEHQPLLFLHENHLNQLFTFCTFRLASPSALIGFWRESSSCRSAPFYEGGDWFNWRTVYWQINNCKTNVQAGRCNILKAEKMLISLNFKICWLNSVSSTSKNQVTLKLTKLTRSCFHSIS